MKKPYALGAALFGALASLTAPASAGERTPVSSIPVLAAPHDAEDPKGYGVPGLALKEEKMRSGTHYSMTAATAAGYCLVSHDSSLRLEASSWDEHEDEMWRLVETDGKATLERQRFQLAPYLGNVWLKSKTSVELRSVANDQGVRVWAMKEASGDVILLAKGGSGGLESRRPKKPEDSFPAFDMASSSCGFGATRVMAYAITHGGGVAQLSGSLPPIGTGKERIVPRYIVDVSASKLTRDPEPVLSLRVRLTNT